MEYIYMNPPTQRHAHQSVKWLMKEHEKLVYRLVSVNTYCLIYCKLLHQKTVTQIHL